MCYECYAGKVKTQDHKNITMRSSQWTIYCLNKRNLTYDLYRAIIFFFWFNLPKATSVFRNC